MRKSSGENWERFQKYYTAYPSLEMALDLSRVDFPDDFFDTIAARMQLAFDVMEQLEKGAIANPDENRMVGHYWLRNPALAPNQSIGQEIENTIADIKAFAAEVHAGKVKGARGAFRNLLVIGIGGSALGPQFVAHALGNPATDKLRVYFFDNTDPDGIDRTLALIGPELGQTLCVVISKSGGTKETRNGMLEAQHAYTSAGIRFGPHAVAITGAGSELDRYAAEQAWLRRFPMWDWVGGRTSETSAVGLLPAALQGIDIGSLLSGAKACDEVTRQKDIRLNPAAQLAAAWHFIGNGVGSKAMVVLPYKDRLELFSKYLQQLVMESLGKEKDLSGKIVNQGLTVFGNKGSTDQHAYVQQLRDGLANFFVTFIEVLQDRSRTSLMVEPDVTSGDFLDGFLLGTREALSANGRPALTITLKNVSPFSVGVLIALFERTVGFYASLVNINAYHQPGVEAGKKAASEIIELQRQILGFLRQQKGRDFSPREIAIGVGAEDRIESMFKICEHLAANERGMRKTPPGTAPAKPNEVAYGIV